MATMILGDNNLSRKISGVTDLINLYENVIEEHFINIAKGYYPELSNYSKTENIKKFDSLSQKDLKKLEMYLKLKDKNYITDPKEHAQRTIDNLIKTKIWQDKPDGPENNLLHSIFLSAKDFALGGNKEEHHENISDINFQLSEERLYDANKGQGLNKWKELKRQERIVKDVSNKLPSIFCEIDPESYTNVDQTSALAKKHRSIV